MYKSLFLLFLLHLLPHFSTSKTITMPNNNNNNNAQDLHPECPQWATEGSCRSDPVFMLAECAHSCSLQPEFRKVEVQHVTDGDASFFELEALDANGKVIEFDRFEGYVTIVMNVGKVCGRAEEIYTTLQQLQSIWPWTLEIIIFPFQPTTTPTGKTIQSCNDEYTTAATKLLSSSSSSKLYIMQDVTLNGPNTHPVYSYLKNVFSIEELNMDHGCTFLISPDGDIVEYHHRQHIAGLKEYIAGHLQADL